MFRSGFVTVIGTARTPTWRSGTAQFLQHNYPTAVTTSRAGRPGAAGVALQAADLLRARRRGAGCPGSSRSSRISVVAAVMLALAASAGSWSRASCSGAGVCAARAAMALVGLDRIVLHTGMHPYFNQTWGYFALPFALVLGWWAIEAAHARRPGAARALPRRVRVRVSAGAADPARLPGLRLVAGRRARRRAGERSRPGGGGWQRIYRGWRSLLWIVPVALAAAHPDRRRDREVDHRVPRDQPNASLQAWGGDLSGSFPGEEYFGLSFHDGWPFAALVLVGFASRALWRLPRPLPGGWAPCCCSARSFGEYFHLRKQGWYFEFKALRSPCRWP